MDKSGLHRNGKTHRRQSWGTSKRNRSAAFPIDRSEWIHVKWSASMNYETIYYSLPWSHNYSNPNRPRGGFPRSSRVYNLTWSLAGCCGVSCTHSQYHYNQPWLFLYGSSGRDSSYKSACFPAQESRIKMAQDEETLWSYNWRVNVSTNNESSQKLATPLCSLTCILQTLK